VPTYQYACTECGHDFEAVQSFSDDSLTECPVCAGRLRKVFNAVGIVFKGSGFYRTDSRNGAGKDGAKDNGKDGSKDKSDKADKSTGADKPVSAGKDGGSGTSTPAAKPDSSSGSGSSGSGSGSSGSGSSGSGSSTASTAASKAGSAA
jgi:putative FmdB family regulatory protein